MRLSKARSSLEQNWLEHVRKYPSFQSKPDPGLFDHQVVSRSTLRRFGSFLPFLQRFSGLFISPPNSDSANPYKVWEKTGETHTPALPQSLLDQPIHDTFYDYHPSFSSRSSFVLQISGGSFHGHDHTLFDQHFRPIDWEPPYWALNCGLPGTLFRKRLPRRKKLEGSALVLSAPAGGGNIWHFLFDSLPKIKLVQDAGMSLHDFDHVLIDSFKMPYVVEALEVLGIDRKRVLETETHPLITADQLTYVTLGCLLPPDPWVLYWLRSVFLKDFAPAKPPKRKIFISRAGATRRRLHGEETIVQQLQRDGFEAIALENLSLLEQVALMSEAKAIVASHGAGLTNLVWCPPDTKVVELFAAEYVNVCYWNISQMLRLDYAFALGEPTLGQTLPPRAVLDMNRLRADQVFTDQNILVERILRFTSAQ
ncbi:MAG: DUF563 domain-containing protein [Puniceicoccaceae bacterium]